jgi:hypothetical protein
MNFATQNTQSVIGLERFPNLRLITEAISRILKNRFFRVTSGSPRRGLEQGYTVLSIHENPDTEELIRRVAANDRQATALLLDRHRERLRRMIAVHFDQRMGARVDPSDIVQEVLVKANAKLPASWSKPCRYLNKRLSCGSQSSAHPTA